jgi:dipeptidyl aminopeptidase/acylaminoacyl peptidase
MMALIIGTWACTCGHAANPPSIEDFASRPHIEDVSISPDGQSLSLIQTHDGSGFVVIADGQDGKYQTLHPVLREPDHFRLTWCNWATNKRVLCGLRGITTERGNPYPITRLVAVDSDGKNLRVLMQGAWGAQGQYQDRIINWNPGPPDTVLIEADEGLSDREIAEGVQVIGNVGTHGAPAVFELNVVSGQLKMRQHARDPVRDWVTDRHGNVRLGYGYAGGTITYWVRLDGDSNWRRMSKFEVFSRESHFTPLAISIDDPNMAYAIGPSEGRDGLWLIDLKEKEEPKLLFSHPLVDSTHPILARDRRLIGARYDDGYPMMYYTDAGIDAEMRGFQKLYPDTFNLIEESSLEDKILLIRSVSDIEGSRFSVYDTGTHTVRTVGTSFPGRDIAALAPMRPISYAARDGTRIPAYISAPPVRRSDLPPLIVMPHGGPIARDTWDYFFLRQFLVSRGYAVLQMNFRGSGGYGNDWFHAAHQDWGGLTYDDVVDGARWAIEHNVADPERVCIVGWSFGGYLALLGAQRNPDLFRCAVDIAGVSDLRLLIDEGHNWMSGAETRKRQLGTDTEKLKHDSPRLHAAEFTVPLLMVHGKNDFQVPFEQSEGMDSALKHAGKPHRFVIVPDADHQFSDVKDRAVLLRETENFLAEHLTASGPGKP